MKTFSRLGLFTAVVALVAPVSAAVQDVAEGAFRTQSVILVNARPAAAWRALVRVSDWWDPAHTWSGSSRNLRLEPRAGGCFCEKLKDGGSVEHARVVFAQPGQTLRLTGALGPLQEMPVTGVLTFTLAPDGPGTRITMTYHVAGALSMAATKLAPLVDQVMTAQFERLRDHANRQND
jgi:uncharacterized protein YndB with AHSA1/START domain